MVQSLLLIRRMLLSAATVSTLILGTQAGRSQADINSVTTILGSAEPWTSGAQLIGSHATGSPLTVALVLKASRPDLQASLIHSLYQKNSPSIVTG